MKIAKVEDFCQQLYYSSDLSGLILDDQVNIVYKIGANTVRFFQYLQYIGWIDQLNKRINDQVPIVFSDNLDLVWLAEWANRRLLILGPVFIQNFSFNQIDEKLQEMRQNWSDIQMANNILRTVPIFNNNFLNHYALMMHYMLTKIPITPADIVYLSKSEVKVAKNNNNAEKIDAERANLAEKLILSCVKEGNLGYEKVLEKTGNISSNMVQIGKRTQRNAKDTLIIFCAVCCRAAIDGGLPPEIAYHLQHKYLKQIESSLFVSTMGQISKSMLADFVHRVHDYKIEQGISNSILNAKDYILNHLDQKLSIDEIAHHAGYSKYYFSKLFYRETGIKITEFINQAKVDYAADLLVNTNKSVEEISEILGFNHRNYFSKIFKEIKGIRPLEYRKKTITN